MGSRMEFVNLNVQSWDRKVQQSDLSGTLSRQGDQIILTSDSGSGEQYPLIDPPADVPLDTKVPIHNYRLPANRRWKDVLDVYPIL